jgi:hypothetical protein
MARLRYALFIALASVVGFRPSNMKGSSVLGSGGGFVLLLDGEDEA